MRGAQRQGDGIRAIALPAGTRLREYFRRGGRELAYRAAAAAVQLGLTGCVLEAQAVGGAMLGTPGQQSVHYGPEVEAGWGEFVELAAGVVRVGASLEDPVLDQTGE